jgi:lysyl-tRNA synthetase class 2
MQVMVRKNSATGESLDIVKNLDTGDFISAQGKVFTTKTGQLTVEGNQVKILAKALRPLPDSWSGLKDVEERYRRRYLDIIINDEVKQRIITRSKIIQAMRDFLLQEGFIEVETPMLETNASGALANPFLTHIDAYDMDVYLRICMGELWQKKLMIAGLEKTFEIGRAFRNEGVDREHNPEFTMMEYYWSYADYKDNMDMQEKLLEHIVKASTGSTTVKNGDHEINFKAPYPRKKFRDIIMEHTKFDIYAYGNLPKTQAAMQKFGFKLDKKWGIGHLCDEFYKQYVRPQLIQPLFLTHHPKDLKPLAKEDPELPGYTQSFQLLANGFEISNNYTELNDPIDQAQRFSNQKKLEESGDNETMSSDEEFVEALEYGMPPTTGTGIGVDRLVALLTGSHHIREIIAFPMMKPAANSDEATKIKPGK